LVSFDAYWQICELGENELVLVGIHCQQIDFVAPVITLINRQGSMIEKPLHRRAEHMVKNSITKLPVN
jgi:hypothetical protein